MRTEAKSGFAIEPVFGWQVRGTRGDKSILNRARIGNRGS